MSDSRKKRNVLGSMTYWMENIWKKQESKPNGDGSVKTTKHKKKETDANVSLTFLVEIGKIRQVTNRDKLLFNSLGINVQIKDKTGVLIITCAQFKSVNNHSECRSSHFIQRLFLLLLMPIKEASSIKDFSGKTVQFNTQQGPKTAHNYWNLARPHGLFSPCKLLQANTRKSWNSLTLGNVFTAWKETLSFLLFLTIISSLFSSFLLFFLPLLPVRFSLFTRALSCSFSCCSTVQFSWFARALSPAVCHWYSANKQTKLTLF